MPPFSVSFRFLRVIIHFWSISNATRSSKKNDTSDALLMSLRVVWILKNLPWAPNFDWVRNYKQVEVESLYCHGPCVSISNTWVKIINACRVLVSFFFWSVKTSTSYWRYHTTIKKRMRNGQCCTEEYVVSHSWVSKHTQTHTTNTIKLLHNWQETEKQTAERNDE